VIPHATLKNQSEFTQMTYTDGENAGGVARVEEMPVDAWDTFGLARSR